MSPFLSFAGGVGFLSVHPSRSFWRKCAFPGVLESVNPRMARARFSGFALNSTICARTLTTREKSHISTVLSNSSNGNGGMKHIFMVSG